jgi:hypothetical protein
MACRRHGRVSGRKGDIAIETPRGGRKWLSGSGSAISRYIVNVARPFGVRNDFLQNSFTTSGITLRPWRAVKERRKPNRCERRQLRKRDPARSLLSTSGATTFGGGDAKEGADENE